MVTICVEKEVSEALLEHLEVGITANMKKIRTILIPEIKRAILTPETVSCLGCRHNNEKMMTGKCPIIRKAGCVYEKP